MLRGNLRHPSSKSNRTSALAASQFPTWPQEIEEHPVIGGAGHLRRLRQILEGQPAEILGQPCVDPMGRPTPEESAGSSGLTCADLAEHHAHRARDLARQVEVVRHRQLRQPAAKRVDLVDVLGTQSVEQVGTQLGGEFPVIADSPTGVSSSASGTPLSSMTTVATVPDEHSKVGPHPN
jgi:hypothetical protein